MLRERNGGGGGGRERERDYLRRSLIKQHCRAPCIIFITHESCEALLSTLEKEAGTEDANE